MHGQRRCVSALIKLVILTTLLSIATGRKGCLNYGHSCLGGHGKRSSLPENVIYTMEKDDLTDDNEINSNVVLLESDEMMKERERNEPSSETIASLIGRSLLLAALRRELESSEDV